MISIERRCGKQYKCQIVKECIEFTQVLVEIMERRPKCQTIKNRVESRSRYKII